MSTTLPSTTDVLICGAGPAGLTTALSILHHSPGTSVTVVDALETGQNQSRALVIHIGTMEGLHDIGCSDAFAGHGIKATTVRIQTHTQTLLSPQFKDVAKWTQFPYALIISQADTEVILDKLLLRRGVTVLRPVKVVGMEEVGDSSDSHNLLVSFDDGRSIRTKYLIGTDGSKSTVRTLANIKFSDPGPGFNPLLRMVDSPAEYTIALADVKLDPSSCPEEIFPRTVEGTLGPHGFFFLVPLDDTSHTAGKIAAHDAPNMFRLGYFIKDEEAKDRAKHAELGFIQHKIDQGFTHNVPGIPKSAVPKATEVIWESTFRVRYALAETFFKALSQGGKVLLAGDAAHVHSPVGGQGMNLGMNDGLALGTAIAAHVKTNDDSHFTKYSSKRTAIAVQIINGTKIGSYMVSITNPIGRWFRDNVMRTVGSIPMLRRNMTWQISGLGWREKQ